MMESGKEMVQHHDEMYTAFSDRKPVQSSAHCLVIPLEAHSFVTSVGLG